MKNLIYKVDRDRIYVGELGRIFSYSEYLHDCNKYAYVDGYYPLRFMIFVITMDGFANDLLYEQRRYPVLNRANAKEFGDNTFAVAKYASLGKLLEKNGYPKEMEHEDVLRALTEFFYSNYAIYNSHLFGLEYQNKSDYKIEPGTIDPSKVEKAYNKHNHKYHKDKDFFKEVSQTDLEPDLFYLMKDINETNKPFKPKVSEEGFVKSLKY